MEKDTKASAGVQLSIGGADSDGKVYRSVDEMWVCEVGQPPKQGGKNQKGSSGSIENWYRNGLDYWKKIEANNEGVLGGYGFTHGIDVKDNTKILVCLKKIGMKGGRMIEMGAGIGRLVKDCFIEHFDKCDLLEPADNMIEKARETLEKNEKMGKFYHCSMQDFEFEQKYDCIWFQWVIGHLTDKDAVEHLTKCKNALTDTVN